MATAKIGALLTAWEIITKSKVDEKVKGEINEAFQRTLFDVLPYKFIAVIHNEDGSAFLGIFQTKEDRDEWIKPAKKSNLEIEVGNGYNLGYRLSKKFDVDLNAVSSYTISTDYTNAIFTIVA